MKPKTINPKKKMEQNLIKIGDWKISQTEIDNTAESIIKSAGDPLKIAIAVSTMVKLAEAIKKKGLTDMVKSVIKNAGLNTINIGNFTITWATRKKKDYSGCAYWQQLTSDREKLVAKLSAQMDRQTAQFDSEIKRVEALMHAVRNKTRDDISGRFIMPVVETFGSEYYSVKIPKE